MFLNIYYFDANSHHFEHFHDFKTLSHRGTIGYQSSDLRSIKNSYLILQDVWRQLFTFLHSIFVIFHWHFHPNNFSNTEYQLTDVLV